MTLAKGHCSAACARATGNLLRALFRLAMHLHGWALWGTLGTVTLISGVWVWWDDICEWWQGR